MGSLPISPRAASAAFDLPEHAYLFSFFLCSLKLRYAFLQNGNSTFEVIYCAARRVKSLLAVGRIFRNQFLEKVYVALQATCSSHHAFFHRADFHTRNILCACATGSERYADSKNQRLEHRNPFGAIMRRGDATRSGRTWAAPVVHAALRSPLPPSGRSLGGSLRAGRAHPAVRDKL
jgi:hypothetical protein